MINIDKKNKKLVSNLFLCIRLLICLFFILNLVSCTKKLIDYDLEIVETKAEETKVFSLRNQTIIWNNLKLSQKKIKTNW